MAAISQTTFLNAFSWMKNSVLWFEFHWRLFPKGPIDNKSPLVQVNSSHINKALSSVLTTLKPEQNGQRFVGIFKCILFKEMIVFYSKFTTFCSCQAIWQYVNNLSMGNGLALNRRQSITWASVNRFLTPYDVTRPQGQNHLIQRHIYGSVQECIISSAKALEIP